jgi:hypothetical protein
VACLELGTSIGSDGKGTHMLTLSATTHPVQANFSRPRQPGSPSGLRRRADRGASVVA